jgi:hypothetical protein
MSILRDLYRRVVIGSWQTPESTRSFENDTTRRTFPIRLGRRMNGRKHPGDPCLCGRGTVYKAHSAIHGDFLGCTAFRTRGCRYAWTIDGRRLPRNQESDVGHQHLS